MDPQVGAIGGGNQNQPAPPTTNSPAQAAVAMDMKSCIGSIGRATGRFGYHTAMFAARGIAFVLGMVAFLPVHGGAVLVSFFVVLPFWMVGKGLHQLGELCGEKNFGLFKGLEWFPYGVVAVLGGACYAATAVVVGAFDFGVYGNSHERFNIHDMVEDYNPIAHAAIHVYISKKGCQDKEDLLKQED